MTCAERGWDPPLESTAPRESAWTCRSARAELGKPLRGLPHGPHRVCYDDGVAFHAFNPDTQTGRRRVFIMTTIQTQRRRWSTRPTFIPTSPRLPSHFYPGIHSMGQVFTAMLRQIGNIV